MESDRSLENPTAVAQRSNHFVAQNHKCLVMGTEGVVSHSAATERSPTRKYSLALGSKTVQVVCRQAVLSGSLLFRGGKSMSSTCLRIILNMGE